MILNNTETYNTQERIYDSGLIIAEKDMSVQAWLAKEDVRPTYYKNRVNAGLHVIDIRIENGCRKQWSAQHIIQM